MPVVELDPNDALDAAASASGQAQPKISELGINDKLDSAAAAPSAPADVPDWLKSAYVPASPHQKMFDDSALKGLTAIPGMFGDVQGLRDTGVDYLMRKGIGYFTGREMPSSLPLVQPDQLPNSETFRAPLRDAGLIDRPDQQPQTPGDKYFKSIVEGGAATLPFGPLALLMGGAGGATGQLGEDLTGSKWGRLIGSVLAPLGVSGAARVATRSPTRLLSDAVRDVTPQQMDEAERIFGAAQDAGTPITSAEAVAQATGGRNRLTDIQRVTEQSRGGGPVMEGYLNGRSQANRQALSDTIDAAIGPAPAEPGNIPTRLQGAAERNIAGERAETNRLSRPAYDATANNPNAEVPTGPQGLPVRGQPQTPTFDAIASDPLLTHAIGQARGNPVIGAGLEQLPDNSMPVLHATKVWLDDAINAARTGGRANEARLLEDAQNRLLGVMDQNFPRYASARNIQSMRRTAVEDPLENSPVGDLSRIGGGTAEQRFAQARDILFPKDPATLTPDVVRTTLARVRMQDPTVAADMANQFIRSHFDKVTRDLSAGASPWGGSKFRASIMGNETQAANLEAAIRSLPNGDRAWQAFNNLMDVFAAQGKRQAAGSSTEFNRQITGELSEGLSNVIPRPVSALQNWWQRLVYDHNTEQVARLLTNPDAVNTLRRLSMYRPSSDRAALIASEALALTDDSRRQQSGTP